MFGRVVNPTTLDNLAKLRQAITPNKHVYQHGMASIPPTYAGHRAAKPIEQPSVALNLARTWLLPLNFGEQQLP
jgi:hypothetical protein